MFLLRHANSVATKCLGSFFLLFFFGRVHCLARPTSLPPPPASAANPLPANERLVKEACKFFDDSPDPFHAVQASIKLLKNCGYVEWTGQNNPLSARLERGGKYYTTRNKSTLVAFYVGTDYQAGGTCAIVGGHTDSPNLRVKPRSARKSPVDSLEQIGVECYGGGLWHTWFDRDLGLSGRVWLQTLEGTLEERMVRISRPILRIPNLAIHLQTAKEREAFTVNKEDHLSPIIAQHVKKSLSENVTVSKDGWREHQEPVLLKVLAEELKVESSMIVDFELSLYDLQEAAVGGANREFVFSARLDNLASCFLALIAQTGIVDIDVPQDQVSMLVLYDHEEVGSSSAIGAASPLMTDTIRRITSTFLSAADPNCEEAYATCIDRSFCLSSDQAHAVHPNYASKHEKSHQPHMNQGMVIKRNSNQRYATNPVGGLILRQCALRAALPPLQEFIVRQDCGCGSTIGPIISSQTGIRAVDVGCPQLSMHSVREQMGSADLLHGVQVFQAFYKYFGAVDKELRPDAYEDY